MVLDYLWVEKYAPQTIDDCILPEAIKKQFVDIRESKSIPNMILAGEKGRGKTATIRALAKELDRDLMVINGSDERTIDIIRNKVKNYASTVSLNPGKKILLIDEGDNMTNDAQLALRGCIEEFQKNCTFIFTCNNLNGIKEPIQSRCPPVIFKVPTEERPILMNEFYKKVRTILELENVTCDNDRILVKFIAKHFPDFRKTLHLLQTHSKSGSIGTNILTQVKDINITLLFKYLKERRFTDVRKWAVENIDNEKNLVLRKVFDGLDDVMEPSSVPAAILILYEHMSTTSTDNEIDLVTCFTKLMAECQWL